MKTNTQREKLLNFGISMLALGIFPLIWFLTQAILFRELTDIVSRSVLMILGILVGSTFVFLLFFGMNKIVSYASRDSRDSLEARMFVVFFVLFIGLIVGWLSDRLNKGEAFFKSIVFLPMAISAVGASAIFKFIYEYRPPPLTQIGIINGIRVSVDQDEYICANNKEIDGVYKTVGDENCLNPIGWLQQRDMSNLPFVQNLDLDNWFNSMIVNIPVNTILLMVIMIWMFTGFAAVVFSAGIKSIPNEIMEAGQIDGASEVSVFTSIVIPYIKSTIVVVGTYMVVTVLKAFDIIYVGTRGDLETNLLAVKMLDEFSKYRNIGRSATVAVLIFVCVFPILWFTIKRERDTAI